MNILLRGARKINSFVCRLFLYLRGIKRRSFHKASSSERIIVSLTSWKKRIENVPTVIQSILNNTVKPDLVVLNLSAQEFPRKEIDLPQSILDLVNDKILEILWEESNSKTFKKFIPTLKKYPNDVIIAIDDDFVYPSGFIETFVNQHYLYPNTPLSGNQCMICGGKAHCGCASLIRFDFYGKYLDSLLDDTIIETNQDDVFYTFCAALNGTRYRYVGRLFFTNMTPINPVAGISDEACDESLERACNYLIERIKNLYHIDFTKINKPHFVI